MRSKPPDQWTDYEKSALVEQVIRGELTVADARREHSISQDALREWVLIYQREARLALDERMVTALSSKGLDVTPQSSSQFSGSLSDIAIPDLLQTVELGRKDALITVKSEHEEGRIWCVTGEVVDAMAGPLTGAEAFYRLMLVEKGEIHASFSEVHRVRSIKVSGQALLMESARRSDESTQLLTELGNQDQVYKPSACAMSPSADISEEKLQVLRLFEGGCSIRHVVTYSSVGALETLTLVRDLLERELLTTAEGPSLALTVTGQQGAPPSSRPLSVPEMSFVPTAASLREYGVRGFAHRKLGWGGVIAISSLGAVATIAFTVNFGGGTSGAAGAPSISSASAESAELPGVVQAKLSACPEGMAKIESGTFFMGSDSDHRALRWAKPAHKVTLDAYCISKLEVSVGQYNECSAVGECERAHRKAEFPRGGMDEELWERSKTVHSNQCNQARQDHDQHPINCVSYHQATQYCKWFGGYLPSEAQWEFAARGRDGRVFPWGDAIPSPANVNACGSECKKWHEDHDLGAEVYRVMYEANDGYTGTAPVGSFPAGATRDGVMDLIGNVFEWTAGGLYEFDRGAQVNPHGPKKAGSYVIRGGAFNSGIAEFSDPALRFGMVSDSYSHGVGFRCAAAIRGGSKESDDSTEIAAPFVGPKANRLDKPASNDLNKRRGL